MCRLCILNTDAKSICHSQIFDRLNHAPKARVRCPLRKRGLGNSFFPRTYSILWLLFFFYKIEPIGIHMILKKKKKRNRKETRKMQHP